MKEMDVFFDKQISLKYWQQNKAIIISSLLIAIISYGYELFNFTLSIDEELESFKKARESNVYLNVGRWGIYFLNQILTPSSVLPYFPTLIALLCIVTTSVLFLSNQNDGFNAKLIFSTVFITNPIHSYYLAFNTIGLYFAFGMLLALLSYLALKIALETTTLNYKYFLFSIILLGFAISIYQALLVVFLVFIAYNLFVNQTNNCDGIFKRTLKDIYKIFIVVILALLFYKVGDISARYFLFEGKFLNNTDYLENFILWGKMPTNKVLLGLILNTGGYLLGMKNFGDVVCLSSKLTIILIPIILYFIVKSRISNTAKLFSVFLLVVLILSPFTINFLNGKPLPTRALMSLALMTAILWILVYRHAGKILRRIMVVAAFLIIINNTYINTRLFYSSYVSWQADREMAIRIIERVYQLNPPMKNGKINIAFVGGYQHPSNELFIQSDVHGSSFFGWDGGDPWRIRNFFRTIAVNDLNIVLYENLENPKKKIEAMPTWPAKGSVDLIKNIVIVKLSNPDNFPKVKQISKLTFHQEFGHLPDSIVSFNAIKSDFKTDYSIDIINDILINKVNQKIFKADENIIIKGWAIDKPSLKPAFAVFVSLNQRLFPAKYGQPRPDVAEAYKNNDYQNVGWELTLTGNELKNGKNQLQIIIIGAGQKSYFAPEQKVEFEVR